MTTLIQYLRLALFVILLTGLPLKGLALSPIIIPDGSFEQTITQYTFFYEDADSELTLGDIVTPDIQLRFAPTHSDVLKRGATEANLWVRLSLHNPLSTPLNTVLTLSNERLDSVRLFDITNLESPTEITGPSLDGSLSQAHAFGLQLGAKEIHSYLVRIETDALIDTLLELKSIDRFNAQEQLTDIMTGATMGLAFLALVYFIYIKARGEDGIVTAGVVCTFSVFLFIPATAGIGSGLPFGADLPHGMVETLSACAILIAQLYAVLQLKWRQFWIRISLYSLISAQLLIAMTDLLIPSYQTEILVYSSAALNQLFIIFVPGFFRSQRPDAHPYLRSGAA
ncbi:MAG: 7TM-DISM domain-containing protein, partial [Thalassolituus sp.]